MDNQQSTSPRSSRRNHGQRNQIKRKSALRRLHSHYKESPEQLSESQSSIQQQQELTPKQVYSIWTSDEEYTLNSLFKTLGADWKEISARLGERSQREIKNHFFKILRKIIDNLNGIILQNCQRESKQINFKQIRTLVEETVKEQWQDEDDADKKSFGMNCRSLVSRLLIQFMDKTSEVISLNEQKQTIETLRQIIQLCKRLRRRKNGSKADTAITSNKEQIEEMQIQRGYQSDSESAFQDAHHNQQKEQILPNRHYQNDYDDQSDQCQSDPEQPVIKANNRLSNVVIAEEEQRIQALLRDSGILEFQVKLQNMNNNKFISGSGMQMQSGASGSQNMNNESYQHFFEDCDLQNECYWKRNCNFNNDE